MASYTEPTRPLEAVLYETPISREEITIASGAGEVDANTVLGEILSATVAADVGNTGAAVVTATTVTFGALAQPGVYTLTCTTAGSTGGGVFQVQAPTGALIAPITAGSAYAGEHISLTLPEGDGGSTADWAVDDIVTITVAGSGTYTPFDDASTDGSAKASAVNLYAVDATSAAVDVAAIVRQGALKADALNWHADADVTAKAAATASLAANHLIIRS